MFPPKLDISTAAILVTVVKESTAKTGITNDNGNRMKVIRTITMAGAWICMVGISTKEREKTQIQRNNIRKKY